MLSKSIKYILQGKQWKPNQCINTNSHRFSLNFCCRCECYNLNQKYVKTNVWLPAYNKPAYTNIQTDEIDSQDRALVDFRMLSNNLIVQCSSGATIWQIKSIGSWKISEVTSQNPGTWAEWKMKNCPKILPATGPNGPKETSETSKSLQTVFPVRLRPLVTLAVSRKAKYKYLKELTGLTSVLLRLSHLKSTYTNTNTQK